MRRVENVMWNGKPCSGESLEWTITPESEQWNTLIAEDGTKVLVKFVITRLTRLDERNPETGDPFYLVGYQPVVVAHCQPHLFTADDIRPATPPSAQIPPPMSGETLGES